MQIHPLYGDEAAYHGATHRVVITYADLTDADASQVLAGPVVKNGSIVNVEYAKLVTTFTSSDATLLSLTAIAGDGGGTNRFLTSYELLTPTPSPAKSGVALSPGLYQYTTDDTVDFQFDCTAAKLLTSLTAGEIHFYLNIKGSTPG